MFYEYQYSITDIRVNLTFLNNCVLVETRSQDTCHDFRKKFQTYIFGVHCPPYHIYIYILYAGLFSFILVLPNKQICVGTLMKLDSIWYFHAAQRAKVAEW